MALAFLAGSTCFLVGPLPGYAALVGGRATAVTFVVGSVFFTVGGAIQSARAYRGRGDGAAGRAAWWSAVVQSAGTVLFNVSTSRALVTALSDPQYDRLVWRPDALGSVCFLVSGAIAYRASPRRGWRPVRRGTGWWQPAVNLLGCVLFGVSAVAGYVGSDSAAMVSAEVANTTTSLGAACFLVCAAAGLRSARHPTRRPSGGADLDVEATSPKEERTR